MVARDRTYTAEEFYDLIANRDDDKRFELLNGKLLVSPLFSYIQGYIVTQLYARLSYYADTHNLGFTFDSNQGYILNEQTALYPTLSFLVNDRIQRDMSLPFDGTPSIAIEVVSSADNSELMRQKINTYFEHGVEAIWVIFADHTDAEIYTRVDDVVQVDELGFGDALLAPDILPDFELPLYTIFPAKRL